MEDTNPLVRALALRTMSYVHVREFVSATVPLVKRLLRDSDPYVRKTAAYCVAKLYDHDRLMVESIRLSGLPLTKMASRLTARRISTQRLINRRQTVTNQRNVFRGGISNAEAHMIPVVFLAF